MTDTTETALQQLNKIKEQNKARAKKYYENKKAEIAVRRKARRDEIKAIVGQHDQTPLAEKELPSTSQFIPLEADDVAKMRPITTKEPLTLELCYEIVKTMVKTGTTEQLADTTKGKYAKNIKQLFVAYKNNNIRPLLNSPTELKTLIDGLKVGNASKRDICVSVLKLLNHKIIPNFPKQKYDEINKFYDSLVGADKEDRSKKQENNVVDKIEVLRDLILKKFGKNSKENIIFKLYDQNPKRDNFHLKMVETVGQATDKEENYLILPKTKSSNLSFLINAHKTGKKFKWDAEGLSKDLSNEIREYIKVNSLKIGEYLFKEPKLGSFIKKMFTSVGKDYITGVNQLRHVVISNAFRNKRMTVEEANELARSMGHDPKTQQTYIYQVKK